MKVTKEELEAIRKWIKPKTKVRKVFKIEEDGSKTIAHVLDFGNRAVFHSDEGPALINKEQKIKEYYLHGIKFNVEDWKEQRRERAGLPWYKNPSLRGTSRI